MKKFLSMFAIAVMVTSFLACDDDDDAVPDGPTIAAPALTNVQVGAVADITFAVTVPGGYKALTVAATGGTATAKSEPTAGSTSGNAVVTFTADATVGAGTVTITVTDNNDKATTQTGAVNKAAEPVEETVFEVSANITENTTWETGKTYILNSRIAVVDGVTLTIQPGVVIKGAAGTQANATALIIARGAKLMAEGTAEAPIIFTSTGDEIEPGMIASPNLDPDVSGFWGGLIILGKAPISVASDNETAQIEGIPADDPNGTYGGSLPDDNSGVIRYVSIRHGGSNIGEGNEINGLTLGGVGSGTVIEYVEVVGNQDDGIEWFGGTVNVTHALVWYAGDDAIDTDQSWGGTLDNFIVIGAGNQLFELDGPEGTMAATHTLKNGSVRASVEADEVEAEGLADLDVESLTNMESIYFFDVVAGQTLDLNPAGCTFTGLEATIPGGSALADFFLAGTDAFATSVAAGANTVGADKAELAWTWAGTSGALDSF
jgi:hypothetical protein